MWLRAVLVYRVVSIRSLRGSVSESCAFVVCTVESFVGKYGRIVQYYNDAPITVLWGLDIQEDRSCSR